MTMTTWQDFDELLIKARLDEQQVGGALVIYHNGERVVDTASGLALPEMPWTTRTLSVNFSIGKGVLATLVAVLVSRGLLDYERTIASYWHEFAAHGKQHITLKDVLTHTAGLFDITSITREVADLLDWQAMVEKVAAMPIGVPQSQETKNYASAYSALVIGWVLGGLIERVTGLSLQAALDEYLAKPLGVQGELIFGASAEILGKIAKPERYFTQTDEAVSVRRKPVLKPDTPQTLEILQQLDVANLWRAKLDDAPLNTANINKLYFDTSQMNLANYKNALMPNARDGLEYHQAQVLQAVIPAANGISTANALATLYAMHADDGIWQGQTLIDANTLAKMRTIHTDGFDAVMPANMRWRLGFHRVFSLQNAPTAYGHMGYNGSVAFCDPSRRLAFAFIHNVDTTMLNDIRQFILAETAIGLAD